MNSNIQVLGQITTQKGEPVFKGNRFETIGALRTLRQQNEQRNKRMRNHKDRNKDFERMYRVEIKGLSRY